MTARRSAAVPAVSAVYVTPTNTAFPFVATANGRTLVAAKSPAAIPLPAGLERGTGTEAIGRLVSRVPSGRSGTVINSRVFRLTVYGAEASGAAWSTPRLRLPTRARGVGSRNQLPPASSFRVWWGLARVSNPAAFRYTRSVAPGSSAFGLMR